MRLADEIRHATSIPFDEDAVRYILNDFFTTHPGQSLRMIFKNVKAIVDYGRFVDVPVSWMNDVLFYLNREGFYTERCCHPTEEFPNSVYVYLYNK